MIHLAIISNIENNTPEKHSLEVVKIIHDTSQNTISPPLSRRFKLPSAFEWNFYKSPKVSHAQFKCNQLEATCRAYPSIPPKKKHHVRNLSKPSNVTTPSTAASSAGSFRAAATLRWCVGVPNELAFLEKGFPVPVCRFLRAAAEQPSFPSEWWWSISRSLVSLIMFTFQPPLRPAGPPSPFHTYWGPYLDRARGEVMKINARRSSPASSPHPRSTSSRRPEESSLAFCVVYTHCGAARRVHSTTVRK